MGAHVYTDTAGTQGSERASPRLYTITTAIPIPITTCGLHPQHAACSVGSARRTHSTRGSVFSSTSLAMFTDCRCANSITSTSPACSDSSSIAEAFFSVNDAVMLRTGRHTYHIQNTTHFRRAPHCQLFSGSTPHRTTTPAVNVRFFNGVKAVLLVTGDLQLKFNVLVQPPLLYLAVHLSDGKQRNGFHTTGDDEGTHQPTHHGKRDTAHRTARFNMEHSRVTGLHLIHQLSPLLQTARTSGEARAPTPTRGLASLPSAQHRTSTPFNATNATPETQSHSVSVQVYAQPTNQQTATTTTTTTTALTVAPTIATTRLVAPPRTLLMIVSRFAYKHAPRTTTQHPMRQITAQ